MILHCPMFLFQVQNCPAKYQVYLKSVNGPIDVVLLNKCSVTSSPIVLPVPPPDDFLQKAKLAMPTTDKTDSCIPPCHTSAKANYKTRLGLRVMEEIKSLSFQNAETNRADGSKCEYLHKFGNLTLYFTLNLTTYWIDLKSR